MWTSQEIVNIARTLGKAELAEFLTSEEIQSIPDSALKNLQNRIITPKHTYPVGYIFVL